MIVNLKFCMIFGKKILMSGLILLKTINKHMQALACKFQDVYEVKYFFGKY